ncbi:MAG: CoA transferase, partial [Actinomycetota bacterium]|nr:CoA transferase [Actinomycetota bacterium]
MAGPTGSTGLDEVKRWTCTPPRADDPVVANRRWLCSTAADLSGPIDGPRRSVPDGLAQGVDVLASAWVASGGPPVDGPALVGARAAAAGLGRRGATSVGGNAHLLDAADGMVCLNLARPEDFDVLPALVGPVASGPVLDPTDWSAVRRALAGRTRAELVEAADLLGLPLGVPGTAPSQPLVALIGPGQGERPRQPVVVEFGSLWAAPLCGGLLARAGFRVVKVESVHRPDGTRRGPASFFASLNFAKEEVTVDPTTKAGLEQVRRLVDGADVVLEA